MAQARFRVGMTRDNIEPGGVGNIGFELFHLAAPFGMKHLACGPF